MVASPWLDPGAGLDLASLDTLQSQPGAKKPPFAVPMGCRQTLISFTEYQSLTVPVGFSCYGDKFHILKWLFSSGYVMTANGNLRFGIGINPPFQGNGRAAVAVGLLLSTLYER